MKANLIFTGGLGVIAAMVVGAVLSLAGGTLAADSLTWDKTFPLSEKVIHEEVSYPNRYGITIAADMYLPRDIDTSRQYAAIIVGTPYGGVKEQGAGIYAQTMAERGFVAIAFDESYNGESGGTPRHVSSPDIFVEDFSAAVDFVGTRPFVDRNRIGVIGICGSGAFSLTAAQVDQRIKAVATVSMYDMSRTIRYGFGDTMTDEQRTQALSQMGEQRWEDFENGRPLLPPGFPSEPAATIPEGLDPITSEFFEYYAMERGHHPNSIGSFTTTSSMSFMNFPLLNYIETISPRPILFVMGERAHSRYFTEDAYERAAEPKELYIVPGARHIDLYDRADMIPFDKLEAFFTDNLASVSHLNERRQDSKGENSMQYNTVFSKGDQGPKEIFTNTTWVNMLHTDNDGVFDTQVYDVIFEPSARTFWHSHPGGQILLITDGTGYYQEKGKPARLLNKGDLVAIPPDVVHWHGAAPDSHFVHIGMSTKVHLGPAKWFGSVTDEEYSEATGK
jgi:fermentation-respiration switch protein FrsA (DUF1100 family)/quercetin dioxygenase-like cupin family protein